jgi:hypothetical protein
MPKDFQLRDVLQKPVTVPQRVSEYKNGRWGFISLLNPIKVDRNLRYYYMHNKFGVTTLTETKPSKTMNRGMGGDYVVLDTLSQIVEVVPAEMFNRLFPTKNHTPPIASTTSALLKNPKKVTEIYEESKQRVSNTTTTRTPTTGY